MLNALRHDFAALTHLLDPDPVAIVRVAVFADRNAPFHLIVGAVGFIFAKVVIDARAAQRGTAEAETEGIFRRNDRDPLGAGQPDPVFFQQEVALVNFRRKLPNEFSELGNEFGCQIQFHATDAVPAGGQPCATELIKPVEQNFTVPERVEENRHGADVERLGAQPEEVANNPLGLSHDRAKIFRAWRDLQVEQLLNSPDVGKIVIHGADIVEPVGVRNKLMIGPALGKLFHAPVQVA